MATTSVTNPLQTEVTIADDKPLASTTRSAASTCSVKVIVITVVVALLSVGIGVVIGYFAGKPSSDHGGEEHLEWGYECNVAPKYWGELSPNYEICKTGRQQSPINVMRALTTASGVDVITHNYSSLVNNAELDARSKHPGFKIVPRAPQPRNRGLLVDGEMYQLLQFHFHSPSEHTINGLHYPLEMHMVHQNAAGNIAVLGLMFTDSTSNNTFLDKFWNDMVLDHVVINDIDLAPIETIITQTNDYWRYDGSFTTPPCTQGVKWFVLDDAALTVSEAQVAKFVAVVHRNNRPIQPRFGRVVRKYTQR